MLEYDFLRIGSASGRESLELRLEDGVSECLEDYAEAFGSRRLYGRLREVISSESVAGVVYMRQTSGLDL